MVNPNQETNFCNIIYLGAEGVLVNSGYFERTYGPLPSHDIIYFVLRFSIIDNWKPVDIFNISIDSIEVFPNDSIPNFQPLGYECNDPAVTNPPILLIMGKSFHTASELTIRVTSLVTQHPNFASFGMRDIHFIITNKSNTDVEQIYATSEPLIDLGTFATGCGLGEYQDSSSGNSCVSCHKDCLECFGPSSSQCYACSDGATYNGTHCINCNISNCFRCSDEQESQCLVCEPNYWLYWNNTCSPTCELPYRGDNAGLVKKCLAPCNPNEYLYPNNSCLPTCEDSTYTATEINQVKICSLKTATEDPEGKSVSKLNLILDAISSVVTFMTSFVDSSNSGSLSVMTLVRMLQHIKYMRINFPPKVQLLLDQQKANSYIFNLVPAPSNSIRSAFPKYPLSEKFEYYKLHSSFVINFWQILMTFIILLGIVCFVFLFDRYIKTNGRARLFMNRLRIILRWNALLSLFSCHYGDVALYSALEYQTIHFNTGLSIFSFFACTGVNILCLTVLIKMLQVNRSIRRLKKNLPKRYHARTVPLIERYWEKYRVFFNDFNDQSSLQQNFLFIFITRTYLTNLVIGFLFDYPLAQTIILTCFNALVLLYLLFVKPMKTRIGRIRQLSYEIVLLVLNISILALARMDSSNIENSSSREAFGELILGANITMRILPTVFLAAEVCIIVRDIRKISRKRIVIAANSNININVNNLVITSPKKIKKVKKSEAERNLGDIEVQEVQNWPIKWNSTHKRHSTYIVQEVQDIEPASQIKAKSQRSKRSFELESQTSVKEDAISCKTLANFNLVIIGKSSLSNTLKLGQIDCGLSMETSYIRRGNSITERSREKENDCVQPRISRLYTMDARKKRREAAMMRGSRTSRETAVKSKGIYFDISNLHQI